jgi:hypothetical protein
MSWEEGLIPACLRAGRTARFENFGSGSVFSPPVWIGTQMNKVFFGFRLIMIIADPGIEVNQNFPGLLASFE